MSYKVVTIDTRNGKVKSVTTPPLSLEAAIDLAEASNVWRQQPRNRTRRTASHLDVVEVR